MNWHTIALALLGVAIAFGAACAVVVWAAAAGGAAIDAMRREEREQWSDDDSEWLGATHNEQPTATNAAATAPGNIVEISARGAQ